MTDQVGLTEVEDDEEVSSLLDEESDDDKGDDQESDDDDADVGPPERRTMPDRSTRGRRFRPIVGKALVDDEEFWGHDTWALANDDEWSTEDETKYKDEFESDFGQSSSEESDEEENAEDAERALIESSRKRTKSSTSANNAYVDPQSLKGKKKNSSTTNWTVKRAKINWSARFGNRYREPSQSEHLASAARTERENLKSLCRIQEEQNWKKLVQEQSDMSNSWQGNMNLWISWASDRKIDGEEQRKRQKRDASPDSSSCTRERNMLFFVNFADAPKSEIPMMYNHSRNQLPSPQRPRPLPTCQVSGGPAKYFDPLTKKYFANTAAFRQNRQLYHDKQHASAMKSLSIISAKLRECTAGDNTM
eukprot:Lankesteria_metandrocarpae@DN1266_c0_g1_i1.p1